MKFKKTIRVLHLWMGLISGIIIFIIAITGCIYAFQEEIQDYTQDYRHVATQDAAFMMPSKLEAIARAELPDKALHAIQYNGTDRSAEAIFYSFDPEYYYIIYLNPYTGEVLQLTDQYTGFFRFILDGHFYLWLPHEIGQTVVSVSTLVFLAMLISGIILWFPKNKKASKQRFWFKWKEGMKWKRKNYDLHNITGFYISLFGLIFVVTGLVWGFEWFASSYYAMSGGEKSLLYEDPGSKSKLTAESVKNPLDKTFLLMQQQYPQASSIEVHPPESPKSSIAANANPDDGTYWKIDYRYFDQYTLDEVQVNHIYGRYHEATASDKLMRMNYDIHTGAILGLPGKIFAFLVSLLIASLPVTGFMIWYGRKNKEKKKILVIQPA